MKEKQMAQDKPALCSDAEIANVTALIGASDPNGRRELDALVRAYPLDPRLHFLNGSVAAGERDYVTARVAMRRAIELAPDYTIARFQYGLLLLTSGEALQARAVLAPLLGLPIEDALRHFAEALNLLIDDRFAPAIDALERGIALNQQNAVLNRDMEMLANELRANSGETPAEPSFSATHLLIQQASIKSTKH
jgi:tetratricopeptide (TPR) repeat protein